MDTETIGMCVVGLGLGAAMLFSGGGDSVGGMMRSGDQIKAMRSEGMLNNVLIQTSNEMQAGESELALQRFEDGCTVHTVLAERQMEEHLATGARTVEYRKVVQGQVHTDYLGTPYSPGAVICDRWGGTGIVGDDGTLTSYAYTGQDVSDYVESHFGRY